MSREKELASGAALSEVLGDHVRSFGREVVVVVSEAALEEVGEAVLIATYGELDRKTIGRVCFQETVKHLVGPQQNPASIVIS